MNQTLKIVGSIFAITAFGVCLMLRGEVSGFKDGMLGAYGIANTSDPGGFIAHGPDFFNYLTVRYFLLGLCFLTWWLGKILRPLELSIICSVSSLFGMALLTIEIFTFKHQINADSVLLYQKWVVESERFDWLIASAGCALLLIDIAICGGYYFKIPRHRPK